MADYDLYFISYYINHINDKLTIILGKSSVSFQNHHNRCDVKKQSQMEGDLFTSSDNAVDKQKLSVAVNNSSSAASTLDHHKNMVPHEMHTTFH